MKQLIYLSWSNNSQLSHIRGIIDVLYKRPAVLLALWFCFQQQKLVIATDRQLTIDYNINKFYMCALRFGYI